MMGKWLERFGLPTKLSTSTIETSRECFVAEAVKAFGLLESNEMLDAFRYEPRRIQ
jgi:hypothetical protein